MVESFCWACFKVCNSDLRVLISECNSGMVTVVLDFVFKYLCKVIGISAGRGVI